MCVSVRVGVRVFVYVSVGFIKLRNLISGNKCQSYRYTVRADNDMLRVHDKLK